MKIDDRDYKLVKDIPWHLSCGTALGGSKKFGKPILMHRLIMKAKEGYEVDHINHDRLDNRRSNLRLCSHGNNKYNSSKRSTNTSGYKGVYRVAHISKWVARLQKDNKHHILGYFANKHEAAKAYNKGAKKHFGKYASLNKIKE